MRKTVTTRAATRPATPTLDHTQPGHPDMDKLAETRIVAFLRKHGDSYTYQLADDLATVTESHAAAESLAHRVVKDMASRGRIEEVEDECWHLVK